MNYRWQMAFCRNYRCQTGVSIELQVNYRCLTGVSNELQLAKLRYKLNTEGKWHFVGITDAQLEFQLN